MKKFLPFLLVPFAAVVLAGTVNKVPKFQSSSILTNSQITDDGTGVGVGTSPASGYMLTVQGGVKASSANVTGDATIGGTLTLNGPLASPLIETYGGTGQSSLADVLVGSATHADNADTATTAGSATTASSATYANTSSTAAYATIAGAASSATTANTANTATNIDGGSAGSIPYQSAANTTAMLSAGTPGNVIVSSGGIPTWFADAINVTRPPYNADNTGALDATTAFRAAIAAADSIHAAVYAPTGRYKLSTAGGLTISTSGVSIVGDGPKATVLAPTFDTDPVITLGGTGLIERVGIRDLEIAHSGRTAGPTILVDNAQRSFVSDVEITGAKIGLQYGTAVQPSSNTICRLDRFRPNTTDHGIFIYGGQALFINASQFNGVAGNSSAAIRVAGPLDGLIITGYTTSETHDMGLYGNNSSGSFSNVYADGFVIDRPIIAGIRLEPTGTGTINQHFYDGTYIFDTIGSGDTTGFIITQSGSATVQRIHIRHSSALDLRQRFIDLAGTMTDVSIVGNTSLGGGVKSAGSYEGIYVRNSVGNLVVSNNVVSGKNNYGIRVSSNCTSVSVSGNAVTGATVSGVSNIGTPAYGLPGAILSSSTVAGSAIPASTQWGDMASITVTPGTYDISASCYFARNGATWQEVDLGVSTTAGNSSTGLAAGYNRMDEAWPVTTVNPSKSLALQPYRVSVVSNTTYYLKVYGNFSVATPAASCTMNIRNVYQ